MNSFEYQRFASLMNSDEKFSNHQRLNSQQINIQATMNSPMDSSPFSSPFSTPFAGSPIDSSFMNSIGLLNNQSINQTSLNKKNLNTAIQELIMRYAQNDLIDQQQSYCLQMRQSKMCPQSIDLPEFHNSTPTTDNTLYQSINKSFGAYQFRQNKIITKTDTNRNFIKRPSYFESTKKSDRFDVFGRNQNIQLINTLNNAYADLNSFNWLNDHSTNGWPDRANNYTINQRTNYAADLTGSKLIDYRQAFEDQIHRESVLNTSLAGDFSSSASYVNGWLEKNKRNSYFRCSPDDEYSSDASSSLSPVLHHKSRKIFDCSIDSPDLDYTPSPTANLNQSNPFGVIAENRQLDDISPTNPTAISALFNGSPNQLLKRLIESPNESLQSPKTKWSSNNLVSTPKKSPSTTAFQTPIKQSYSSCVTNSKSRLTNSGLSRKLTFSQEKSYPFTPSKETQSNTLAFQRMMARAKKHRISANNTEAKLKWNGDLPDKTMKNAVYSTKVFLGGIPWGLGLAFYEKLFQQFGKIKLQWPGKDITCSSRGEPLRAGYLYCIFESSDRVKELLNACDFQYDPITGEGKWYWKMNVKLKHNKPIEIKPWNQNDHYYAMTHYPSKPKCYSLFVGALHGMITAKALAQIINDLFGDVLDVTIDLDKYMYPHGSAKVSILSEQSYRKAVDTGVVEVISPCFNKKIQLDPYLKDFYCSYCMHKKGPVFCRDTSCFKYFCVECFETLHNIDSMKKHVPLIKCRNDHK